MIHMLFNRWKDELAGIDWLHLNIPNFHPTHKQALDLQDENQRLPTFEEFKKAEKNWIRDALDLSGKWFWSSTTNPNDDYYAYAFDGSTGYLDSVGKTTTYRINSVLMVVR